MDLDHERRMTEIEQRSKSNTKRLDDMEKRQDNFDDLVSTVKVLADREARIETDIGEIKTDIKDFKEKPGKRWDGLVDKAIWAFAAAVIGFILAKIGL